ncbi:MAG: hypothetical protein AB1556_07215 [Bacillota bacterium]
MSTNYYGSDSGQDGNPQNPCSTDPQFYIGKIGENLTIGDFGHFNYTLAHNLLNTPGNKVYGYWFVHGPLDSNANNYPTPYDYGRAQGLKAKQARDQFAQNGHLNGLTIFADIEQHSTWSSSDFAANQAVINGFLSAYNYAGPYSAPCAWQDITGSVEWRPDLPADWAGSAWTYQYNYGSQDPGCIDGNWSNWEYNAPCGSTKKVMQGFGGFAPAIWQYAIDVSVGGGRLCDWDIAWVLPE